MTREEAIKALTLCIDWAEHREESCCDYVPVELLVAARNLLERQKGRNGKWVRGEFGSKCSCCGLYTHRDKLGEPWESKFCPNCGAKMEEEK